MERMLTVKDLAAYVSASCIAGHRDFCHICRIQMLTWGYES